MGQQPLESMIVGDIVAMDFRAAAVFDRFGIDFCCGGRRSVTDACERARVDVSDVVTALGAITTSGADADDPAKWPADRLIDYIVETHHGYVRSALPTISAYLAKLEAVHGQRHPELARVRVAFGEVAAELEQHMMKEEQVLFPYVRQLAEIDAAGATMPPSPFGTVGNPIRMMEHEHQAVADEMGEIRVLTDGYVPPADGCTTYRVGMAELERFENDLHRHIHLENNALFPNAIAMERRTGGRS